MITFLFPEGIQEMDKITIIRVDEFELKDRLTVKMIPLQVVAFVGVLDPVRERDVAPPDEGHDHRTAGHRKRE